MLQLSHVRPDRNDLVAQLSANLQSFESWSDTLTISTGRTLIDMIAAVGAYDQYSIESALQETFPATAKNNSSLYATAQMLGVRLARKVPAAVTVSISSPTPVVVPAYAQFTGAGSFFFTREVINVDSTPQTVTLYQGQVSVTAIPGIGTDFQAFVTTDANFSASDTDISVWINDTYVEKLTSGLWNAKLSQAFQDLTLPDGRAVVLFGNDVYGSKPQVNDTVIVAYAITSGLDGNNLVTDTLTLTSENYPTVEAVCIGNPAGGANEPGALIYKSVAAPLFGSFDSAVTSKQYLNTCLTYPGVIDAKVFAQRDMNPRAVKWMKLFRTVVLTSSVWDNAQKQAFIAYLESKTMSGSRFYLDDPQEHSVNVDLDIYCRNTATLASAVNAATAAIQPVFALATGALNRNVYLSDVIDAVLAAHKDIEYVTTDFADVIVTQDNVAAPTLTFSDGGGTLVPGLYDYAVSYTSTFGGETAPAKWTTGLLEAPNNAVHIDWEPVANVVDYKVWGRTSEGTLGLLATLPNTTTTFDDDGTVVPAAPLVAAATVPVVYVTLGSLTIRAHYADRTAR